MNKPLTRVVAAAALALSAPALAHEAHLDFVGLSDAPARGDAGIITMHRACHATYPGARMCTSRDVQLTRNPPAINGVGWVQPVFVAGQSEPGVYDISGAGLISRLQETLGEPHTTPTDLSCFGWSSQEGYGLNLTGGNREGAWDIIQCDFVARVACCGDPRPPRRERLPDNTSPDDGKPDQRGNMPEDSRRAAGRGQ